MIVRPVNTRTTGTVFSPGARNIPSSGPFQQPVDPRSFGVGAINPGAEGQGLVNLGQGVARFAQNMQAFKQRVDTTTAEEALVNFERERNDMFFNPETGYFNTQGRTAYDNAEPTRQALSELQTTYSESIDSPEARAMFQQASEAVITRSLNDVSRHASTQFNAWERSTLSARVENSLESASLYWDDDDRRGIQLEVGRQSLIDLAFSRGDSAETLAEDIQTFNSKFAVNTITAALEGSGSAAAQVSLADNKELLEGPDLVDIQKKIDQRTRTEVSQANAMAAVQTAGSLVNQYGGEPNARQLITDEVNKIEDPDLQSRTLRESMYRLGIQQTADSERRASSFVAAEEFVYNGGSVQEFITQNPNAWEDLTTTQKRTIEKGVAVSTDYQVLSDLLLLPDEELAKVNPADYFTKLATSDRQRLINAVNSARDGSGGSQIGRTRTAEMNSIVDRLFGEKSSRNKNANYAVDEFYAMMTAEMEFREVQKGSPLSSAEFTSMLNDMTRTTVIQDGGFMWFDREMDITDVPADDMSLLSAELRRRGIPTTADNLIKAYNQGQQ